MGYSVTEAGNVLPPLLWVMVSIREKTNRGEVTKSLNRWTALRTYFF